MLLLDLAVPDEVSAIVLKALASQVRSKATDIVDIWRCLEVGLAADLRPSDFVGSNATAASAAIRSLFADRRGHGMASLISEQRLSGAAADERYTRIRALIGRLIGQG